MQYRARVRAIVLAILLWALAAPAGLASTRTVCIVGGGTDTPWAWGLENTGGQNCQENNAGPVSSATAVEVARVFRDSINSRCSGVATAKVVLPGETEFDNHCIQPPPPNLAFEAGLRISGGGTDQLTLFVAPGGTDALDALNPSREPCPDQPAACNFNPQASGTILADTGSSLQQVIPALQPWHYAAIVVLIVAAGVLLTWRRPGL